MINPSGACYISIESQVRMAEKLDALRIEFLKAMDEGRGPKVNPARRGECLYFEHTDIDEAHTKYYIVLIPGDFGETASIPTEPPTEVENLEFSKSVHLDTIMDVMRGWLRSHPAQ